jgi:hypothetical protein
MGRCLQCGKDAGLLMSYCEACVQAKEPFRLADRCGSCGTLILPDALYCKNCAAPEASNLTIFTKETEKAKRSVIDRKVETAATTSANAVATTLVQGMSQRILTLLNILKAKGQAGLTGSILDFKVNSKDVFELQTSFTRHKTFLRFETSGADEVLRTELTHFFGHLDLSKADNPSQFLYEMLVQNVPSFRNSGYCLGIREHSPFPLVCLTATHQFILTLSDADIAEMLSIAIFDLKMGGLLFTLPPPIITWD